MLHRVVAPGLYPTLCGTAVFFRIVSRGRLLAATQTPSRPKYRHDSKSVEYGRRDEMCISAYVKCLRSSNTSYLQEKCLLL